MVSLKTLSELQAFWAANRMRLPFSATIFNPLVPCEFLSPFEWVFASSIHDLVKAVTRWDQGEVHAEWRAWSDESMENSLLANIDPIAVANRGWWVLVNYPEFGDEFGWSAPASGTLNHPALMPEEVACQFQIELFEHWQQNDRDLMAFAPDELDFFIAGWNEGRLQGGEYYGSKNEQSVSRVVM